MIRSLLNMSGALVLGLAVALTTPVIAKEKDVGVQSGRSRVVIQVSDNDPQMESGTQ